MGKGKRSGRKVQCLKDYMLMAKRKAKEYSSGMTLVIIKASSKAIKYRDMATTLGQTVGSIKDSGYRTKCMV